MKYLAIAGSKEMGWANLYLAQHRHFCGTARSKGISRCMLGISQSCSHQKLAACCEPPTSLCSQQPEIGTSSGQGKHADTLDASFR